MNTKQFQRFLEKAQKILTSNEDTKTGCAYMDALEALFPSMYSRLPEKLNTALYREHTPLLFEYLIRGHEK